ncbi:MAG TPA: ABC transporter permease [Alphaproteobacteria bacterium]|jgi:ABC-type polysaccharide/polyol phosphate export permease|nr:ABC transporter permease [Alphaproteobacteria bacterium]
MTQVQSVKTASRARVPEPPSALPKPPSMGRNLALAYADFVVSLESWRMWLLLGMNDIRQRYRRSRLGQFWITMAMATTIVSLGILYAYLFKMPLGQYLPYLGTSFVIWSLISSVVMDSCTVFISAEGFIRQVPLPKSVFVHRMLVRNAVIFFHNLIILPFLFVIFRVPIGWSLLEAFAGIAMILLNGVWIGLFLGTACARFRDLPQIVASLVQVAFYLTPVMWRPVQLPPRFAHLTAFNPFQAFLEIVRAPLLGSSAPAMDWIVAGTVTVVGFALTALVFARFRARIVYWL